VARDYAAMRKTLAFSLRNVAFVVVPAMVGLIVLREPIVRLLFQHRAFGAGSTELTAWALLFYAVGLPAFAAVGLLVRGFYAVEDTSTPVRTALVAMVANITLCFLLVGPLRQGGLALATSLASYVNLLLLYVALRRRLGALDEGRLALSFLRTLAAAAGMGAACWYLQAQMGFFEVTRVAELLGRVLAAIAAGVASYLALAWLLRAEELAEVYTFVTGRQMKNPKLDSVAGIVPETPNHD
jgi:putative peptidoglycan lipid II flippase